MLESVGRGLGVEGSRLSVKGGRQLRWRRLCTLADSSKAHFMRGLKGVKADFEEDDRASKITILANLEQLEQAVCKVQFHQSVAWWVSTLPSCLLP